MIRSTKLLREVLARRTAIVGAVATILSLLVNQGVLGADLSAKVNGWVTTLFLIVSLIVTVVVVRPAVTPVEDPHDNEGNALVPEPNPEDVVAIHDTTIDASNPEAYEQPDALF